MSLLDVASNSPGLQVGQASRLLVNGQLQANNSLVLKPGQAPSDPTAGQLYYDQATNQPYYYNGNQFISLAPQLQGQATTQQASATTTTLAAAGSTASILTTPTPAGTYLRSDGTTFVSSIIQPGDIPAGSTNYIQNQNSAAQASASFWIDGTGRADSGMLAPSLDTSSAGVLSLGSTNATEISLEQDTTIVADKNFTANGSALFKNATDSVTVFQIQDSSGTGLFTADTTNTRIGIGSSAPTNTFTINSLTTNTGNSTAQAVIGTASVSNKALVLQGVASQTANLFEAQSSTGAVMASIGATGATTFKNTTDSTTAFQIQQASGTALLNADTAQGTLSVGTFVPTTVYTPMPVTRNYYTSGNSPTSITNADFNGDGKPDLAIAGNVVDIISVRMNSGTGTFPAGVAYTAGDAPNAITTADFNGDSYPDLAVTNITSDTVSVFMNTGTGTFAPKVDYAASDAPRAITTADFNGDGKPDLAVTNQNISTVSVFINTGTGTFAAKVDYAIVGTVSRGITTADFNGDSYPDLAVPNYTGNSFSVLMNTGTGTFAPKVDYTSGALAAPDSITSADFNGDGQVDFAATGAGGSNNVLVVLLAGITATVQTQPTSKLIVNTAGATIGQLIQGTAGQTGDLLQIRDDISTVLLRVGATGNTAIAGTLSVAGAVTNASTLGVTGTLTASGAVNVAGTFTATGSALSKNASNSVSAFQVQQASGTKVLTVDTTNSRVGIGSSSPTNKLTVDSLTTADALAQVAIGTSATTNKGVVIQGVASQTANLFETQSSTGAIMASIGATGATTFKNTTDSTTAFQIQDSSGTALLAADTTSATITVQNLVVLGTLTVNGHIVSGGSTPSFTAGSAACTTPTVSVSGTDTSGKITVVTGTGCSVTGILTTISFAAAFTAAPRVTMIPANANSAVLQTYVDESTLTTTSFDLDTTTIPTDATTYSWFYHVIQ